MTSENDNTWQSEEIEGIEGNTLIEIEGITKIYCPCGFRAEGPDSDGLRNLYYNHKHSSSGIPAAIIGAAIIISIVVVFVFSAWSR